MDGLKNKRDMRWLWFYSALFLLGISGLLLIMLGYGRTLIWIEDTQDGLRQHYTAIGYVGKIVRDLLAGKGYRMVNFSLGQGMDTLTTLSYYGYTDPISLLAVLAGGNGIETIYAITDFLRMYLAGVFFGVYARKVGAKENWAVACAALIYVFSGFFTSMLGRHPYFINGPLYLSLLLLGAERIFENRKWLMFTLVTALMLAVNFYFAYMNTVIAIVYIIIRLVARLRDRGVKESAKDGFMLLGAYLLGAALSAAVFLPVAKLFLSSSRIGVSSGYRSSMLRYRLSYYLAMLRNAFVPRGSAHYYSRLNYIPLAFFGVAAVLFMRDKRARQVRVGLLLCLVALCVPMLGKLMNGMAYVTNRWSYALALFVALACAFALPELVKSEKSCRKPVAGFGFAVSAVLALVYFRSFTNMRLIVILMFVALSTLLLIYDARRLHWLTERRMRVLLTAFTAVCCAFYLIVAYFPKSGGYIRAQAKTGVYQRIESATGAHLIQDDGVYRVGQSGYDDSHAMLLDYMGTSFYWSLIDGETSRYYQELGLPAQPFSYHVETLGASSVINAVAAVKYYVRQAGDTYTIPYGYAQTGTLALSDGKTAELYENAWALPLGYAYDAYMPQAQYDALPIEDKLQALTQYAILGEQPAGAVPNASNAVFKSAAVELDYDFAELDGAEWADGKLSIERNGCVKLSFDAPEDTEVYLIMDGLRMRGRFSGTFDNFTVCSENGTGYGALPKPSSNFYYPKNQLAFCLGEGALDGCEILMNGRSGYSCDNLRVVCLPLSDYRESMQARRTEAMTDVALYNNRITGRIAVGGERVLQIAIPYSEGWRAWVDGEEQPVFRCGGMYMGVAMAEGMHEIDLRYVTPGLRAGAVISGAAALLILALLIAGGISKRNCARLCLKKSQDGD